MLFTSWQGVHAEDESQDGLRKIFSSFCDTERGMAMRTFTCEDLVLSLQALQQHSSNAVRHLEKIRKTNH